MAHLLPSAGVMEPKGDQYRFYNVVENLDCPSLYDDIPSNIHCYRWTDYQQQDADCRMDRQEFTGHPHQPSGHHQKAPYRVAGMPGLDPHLGVGFASNGATWDLGSGYSRAAREGWDYCPPIGIDPRSLIRPLDKSVHSSTRPTGQPYFAQESLPSCPPHQAPVARKGGFNYQDWLATYSRRLQPVDLRETCVPSLCNWCQPIYVDCCPDYRNPWAYTVAKKVAPYYY